MKALLQKDGFIHYQSIDPTGEPAQRTIDLLRKYSSHCINQPRNQICP